MTDSRKLLFRHDINGLRALAVVLVVLFHFRVPGFEAGFLGVDVFFVISGYLMAALMMRGLESGQGQGALLWSFYFARARRIVPALVVLVAVLLAIGWWTLSPADYAQLATHAQYALVFASNHEFFSEAGYFDVASHEKWLLHTWSLAVEWQFYLILPILFLVVWRWRSSRRLLVIVVGVAAALSLFVSIRKAGQDPEAAFYLLPSRAWELLVGSLVYLLADRVHWSETVRRWLEATGIALILLAVLLFDETTPWPGLPALLPVAGAALVILASRHATGWAMPLAVQWLGRVSYSLYLWHWPVFVGLVFLGMQHEVPAITLGILVSLILAGLSFTWVEQPTSHGLTRAKTLKGVVILIFVVATVAAIATFIHQRAGVPDRMPERFDRIMAETGNINPYRAECHGRPAWEHFPWCTLGGENIRAVVVGDSHAASIATAVQAAVADASNDGVIMATYTSCPTIFEAKNRIKSLECNEFNSFVEENLRELPSDIPVVVMNRLNWAVFGSHLEHDPWFNRPAVYFGDEPSDEPNDALLREFRTHVVNAACRLGRNRPVYWVRPVPEMPMDVPRWLARQILLRGDESQVRIPREVYEKRSAFVTDVLRQAERECANVHMLDPAPWLCGDYECYGSRGGMPLYYDEHHLSERGNRALVPMFVEALGR